MYEAEVSRANPGCLVFLLDRSDSMSQPWAGTPNLTLAEGAAQALNRVLYEVCLTCAKEPGAPPRHYFDIGVFGYGKSASSDRETVESALSGPVANAPLVSLTDLATHPLAVREVQHSIDLPPSRMPIWIEPIHGQRTPMCQAIAIAGQHVADWVAAHPDSLPPIVINITDGMVTDSPYQKADISEWARRLRSLHTNDGNALLLNVFLSPDATQPSLFPSTGQHLPEPGPLLFSMSSELPPVMVRHAAQEGYELYPGARGMAFNADMSALVKFLEIGTKTSQDAVRA